MANFLTTDNANNSALTSGSTSRNVKTLAQDSMLRTVTATLTPKTRNTLKVPQTREVIARLNARLKNDPDLRNKIETLINTSTETPVEETPLNT